MKKILLNPITLGAGGFVLVVAILTAIFGWNLAGAWALFAIISVCAIAFVVWIFSLFDKGAMSLNKKVRIGSIIAIIVGIFGAMALNHVCIIILCLGLIVFTANRICED